MPEITNSIFNPAQVNINQTGSATFARGSKSNITDSYCTTTLGTNQGEQIFALDLPEGVTASYTGDAANKKTVGSKTYYKPGATFTLTLDKTNANLLANYAKVNGFNQIAREFPSLYRQWDESRIDM